MNQKPRLNLLILMLCTVLLLVIQTISYGFEDQKTKDFWDNLSGENYEQAINIALEKGHNNAVYLEIAYYLEAISFRSTHLLHQIYQEIRAGKINNPMIDDFEKDMKQYLDKDSPFTDMINAIIEYNEKDRKASAIRLVSKALSKKETTLGYYLQYQFRADPEALSKAVNLSKLPGFLNQEILISSFNQITPEEMLKNMEQLLANDEYYFDKDDYLNFIQMGLGESEDGVGPSGPNDEPYLGPLYKVTAWDSFKKFAPRHQVLFALAVAGPGGQNSDDAEKLLAMIDEKTKQTYVSFIKMIRIYEDFHAYRYPEVYNGADELLAMQLNNPAYFMYIYDLAHEYEMFYADGYHVEQPMIEKALKLYEKAYQLVPELFGYWRESTIQGKGRSQFYAGEYTSSLDSLKQALTLHDDPLCYMFICFNYYALKDSKNGTYWENKTRKAFAKNKDILRQFEQLLKTVKKK